MQFKDIVGQRDVINRLTEIIDSGRVSHAQMIVGRTEAGAVQLALAYMQYLCCQHRQHFTEGDLHADSCGECPQCKKISGLMHPDLSFVFPTAPNGSSSVSSEAYMQQYRDFVLRTHALGSLSDFYESTGSNVNSSLIRETDAANIVRRLNLKSYEGGWKMLLIWLPERMNREAANEVLKTLEEPTEHTLIMLVSEAEEQLLPTIRSRVQTLRLHSVESRPGAEMADVFGPLMVGWLRQLFKLKMFALSAEVDKIAALNRFQRRLFLNYTLAIMRDCFLHTVTGAPCTIGSGDERFDAMFPNMITPNNIELVTKALDEAIFAEERNANAKIAIMQLSFSLSKALKKR